MKIKFSSELCTGCKACEGACKQEYNLPVGIRWRRVEVRRKGEYPNLKKSYYSMACNNCDKPECMSVCRSGAIFRDTETNIVVLDENKCEGCKACVGVCPIQAIDFHEQTNKASKCNLCIERIKKGLDPACVQTCMGLALKK